MKRIVIIGGGLSGILLSLQLLKQDTAEKICVTVIEKEKPHSLGLAYSTDQEAHLLNVPAGSMSAFPDVHDHFLHWLQRAGCSVQPAGFYPRKLYRKYILQTLEDAVQTSGAGRIFKRVQEEATDIFPADNTVLLGSGEKLVYDQVVLALGNFDPAPLNLPRKDFLQHPRYFGSAWQMDDVEKFSAYKNILIAGSGLTMADTVLSLQQQGYDGHIVSLSTNGLLPLTHCDTQPFAWSADAFRETRTALGIFRLVRNQLAIAKTNGLHWQAVIDAMRPYTQAIWRHLPLIERQRFMEHLRPIWNVARHRMPSACAAGLHRLIAQKKLELVAARLKEIVVEEEETFRVGYRPRGVQEIRHMQVDAIINCKGPAADFERLKAPLIQNLLRKGLIQCDAMKLGIDCTTDLEVIGTTGTITPDFYTLGPPTRGVFWEITGVPEIRKAAAALARLIQVRTSNYCR